MPREPKPYVKDGWYRTSMGGVQHQPLCRVEEGLNAAKLALARLKVNKADGVNGGTPATATQSAAGKGPTVTSALDDFLNSQKAENAEETYDWYVEKLRPFYERFGDRPINRVTYDDGVNYKTWLRFEKPWRRGEWDKIHYGLGNVTANMHIRAAKAFLNWCCKPSKRAKYGMWMNPWEEIEPLPEKPRERTITEEELKHVLANCTDGNVRGGANDHREQLTLLRYTTMRPQELRLLKWDYVHWDENRIVFPSTVIKTRKRREAVLIERAKEVLTCRKARFQAMGKPCIGYVFTVAGKHEGKRTASMSDKPISAEGLCDRFRNLFLRCVAKGLIVREKAGEKIVPYSTRHTRITEMFVEGVNHAKVMFDAGHTNPLTTERYKHLAGSHVADEIRSKARPPSESNGG